MSNIFNQILISNSKLGLHRCLLFGNAEGKEWIMPCRNMRTAMNLYQPSGRKGKWLKSLLPCSFLSPFISKAIHSTQINQGLSYELRRIFAGIWGCKPVQFAIFGGTPGIHCKLTMQISRGKKILGYCKITDSAEIVALFDREYRILNKLHQAGITQAPKPLYRGQLQNGLEIFVQSTTKTAKSQVVHEWGVMHDNYINSLYEATKRQIPFEESDFYKTLTAFKENIALYPLEEYRDEMLKEAERVLDLYRGKSVEFSAYHADFTPWNTFANDDELFAFDWEYARASYPPFLDRYHFFTQTAIFESHTEPSVIIEGIRNGDYPWLDVEQYKLYLIDVTARFTLREKGKPAPDIVMSMHVWATLLTQL